MDKQELETIVERIRRTERQRDGKYGSQWRDWERRYRSQPEQHREGSNLFVPHTFMQCEVIKARVEESLFASRPYVAALPREGTDQLQAENIQTLLDWQMNDRMDLPRLISQQVVGSMVVYGTAVVFTGWQVRTRFVRRTQVEPAALVGDDGQPLLDPSGQPLYYPATQVAPERQVVYDDPVVRSIPLYDFFIDPEAERIEDARYLGHREYMTRSQLEDLEEQGLYTIDWDKLESGDPDGNDSTEDWEEPGLYLVHQYWEDQRHVVILGRSQCALEEENPFWHGEYPYDTCCFVPLAGEFYGMGVPEILAGLQDELNTSRNQRIDYNSMALRRMWKLRKGCGLTNADLVWRQNGVLQVENMDDVQEINLQGLPADAFTNEAGIKQDMQDATGCHDIIMGLGYANETATTTMTRDNNASLRFKSVVQSVVKDIMLPIARKFIALDRQFLSEARVLRLLDRTDGDLFRLDPTDLGGDYDVIYCGSAVESLANKELNKNKALQAYSLALSDPAYQADDGARLRLFRRVLQALDMEDADQLLPDRAPDSDVPNTDARSTDVRSTDVGSTDVRSTDVGSGTVRSRDVGSADVRSTDVGSTDVGSSDARSRDVGSTDVGSRGLEGLSTRGVAALALLLAALRKQQ